MLMQKVLWFKLWLESLWSNEEGQGLVEYALILVLIAIVVIVALRSLGVTVDSIFTEITTELGGEILDPDA